MSILDSVAGIIGNAFANIFYAGTLYRVTSRTSDGRGGFALAWTDFTCKALVDDYSAFLRGTLGIPATERKIIILGASCAAIPAPGDIVTVQGASWLVIETKRDPAGATYECRSKPSAAPVSDVFVPSLDFSEPDNSMYIGQVA